MANTFTASDWELIRKRAASTATQLRAKGATVSEFQPLPPISQQQLNQFARETGLVLPGDFSDLLTKFAGGWNFYWSLHVKHNKIWLKPTASVGTFGGNGEVPFIGASKDQTLLDLYRSFQTDIHGTYLDDPDTLKLIPTLFPLHGWDGGGGDYTVLRLDVSPACVYYLDHEIGWPVDNEHVIGRGFREFVLGWANLGFPQCEYHSRWVNPETRQPDDLGSKAESWRKWLSDPSLA
jgi:hypothetical protein